MFLSQITPLSHYQPQRWSIQQIHKTIWDFFADDPNRKRDFLYRYDLVNSRPRYLVLSNRQPEHVDFWTVETKSFRPQLSRGDALWFKLKINPVVVLAGKRRDPALVYKNNHPDWRKTQTHDQVLHDVLFDWLAKRSERCGFTLHKEAFLIEGYEQHTFRKSPRGQRIHMSTAELEGRLTVTDVALFQTTLANGIGKAKGYGCGMLLVKR